MTRRLLIGLLSSLFIPAKALASMKAPRSLPGDSYLVLFVRKGSEWEPTNAWQVKE